MSTTGLIILIVVALAVIIGNIMLLRKSTDFPRPKTQDNDKPEAHNKSNTKNSTKNNGFDDEEDDW